MNLPPLDHDDVLLDELRAAYGGAPADTVPPEFVAAGIAAFAWRTVDAELALFELVFDSAVDAELATRSGAAADVRILTFQVDDVTVEIEVSGAGIVGQITPANGWRVRLETVAAVSDEATTDAVGCFVLPPPPPAGPARLHLQAGPRALATPWTPLTP
ncbi:hypothetical protein WEI85_07850 [Actinomycetes bacterium KLBMP 9797]